MFSPLTPLLRPAQYEILQYKSGKWSITAAPGSGKTFILSYLAASLANRFSAKDLAKGREVLVVTYTQSAVHTLSAQISQLLKQLGQPESVCRVRTLHGLAHDIARERPASVGLADDFIIVDERVSYQILSSVFAQHFDSLQRDLISDQQFSGLGRQGSERYLLNLCLRFIRHCKDQLLLPGDLYIHPSLYASPWGRFALRIYDAYQRALIWRGAVDFDDLTMLAIGALEENPEFLDRLRSRWTTVLEDEAQDSTHLQQRMLHLLSRDKCWVRVGDPNQAIYASFTTSTPRHFLLFSQQHDVKRIEMSQSGRPARPLVDLANAFVTWVTQRHPIPELRSALHPTYITSPFPGDPQPAPPTGESHIHIHYQPGVPISPDEELDLVVRSLRRWIPENMDKTVAALVPDNWRGHQLINHLKRNNIPYDDLLRVRFATRTVVEKCSVMLNVMAFPAQSHLWARLYRDIWWKPERCATTINALSIEALNRLADTAARALANTSAPESVIWPAASPTPVSSKEWGFLNESLSFKADFETFLARLRKAFEQPLLDPDQQLLVLAHEFIEDPVDLAVIYQIAALLRALQSQYGEIESTAAAREIRLALNDDRRLGGLSESSMPHASSQPGKVAVVTFHGAKGLEWDRVYLLSVNNLAFPSMEPLDRFTSERVAGGTALNLAAELIEMITEAHYQQGTGSMKARIEYCAERLRLLYVGITRARRDLIVLWHNQRYWHQGKQIEAQPALPLRILHLYLNGLYTP